MALEHRVFSAETANGGEMLRYDDIAQAITARHVGTPLAHAEVAAPRERASNVLSKLQRHSFDQAPVLSDGQLVGWIQTTTLAAYPTRSIGRLMHRLQATTFVSADAPMTAVVEALADSQMVFVVQGRKVDGFIVAADLNKHAARTHFYLLVADLELALVALLRRRYLRIGGLLNRIPSAARTKARKRFQRDRMHASEIDQLAVLDFPELLLIVGRSPRVREALGFRSEPVWERATDRMNRFRIAVMHPSAPFIGEWTPPAVVEMERRLRTVLEAAWVALQT